MCLLGLLHGRKNDNRFLMKIKILNQKKKNNDVNIITLYRLYIIKNNRI